MKLVAAFLFVVALTGCGSEKMTDGLTPHLIMRASLACQDRSVLMAIFDLKADGDSLMSNRLATSAIEDGNCRLLRYGNQVIAEPGQYWYDVVRVGVAGRKERYWVSTASLFETASKSTSRKEPQRQ